jgi:hypothetical protein
VDNRQIRTSDAIERTTHVVVGTLIETGTISPGPPGAHHVDEAKFRIERVLTPRGTAPPISGTVSLSYTRQVLPEAHADPELQRGTKYVLFGTSKPGRRLHALKIVPHSDEAVRVVASAFAGGAKHSSGGSHARLA